jgi:hypothetical protein
MTEIGPSSAAEDIPRGGFTHFLPVSKTTFCSVPALWTLEEYSRHRCDDYSHKHLSRGQVLRFEREGRVRWLRRPDADGRGAVLLLMAAPAARERQAAPVNRVTVRGLSCRVGWALAVEKREMWARVMLAQIAMRVNDAARDAVPELA